MRTFFFIIHTETFAMFSSTSVAHQTQSNCNKLQDDLVWTKCNPIKATFNMFQCNSNLAGIQPTLLRVVYTTELYQPHIFHMKCMREMSSIPVGQLRKIYRQKRLTKCFHLSIFHDSFLLFIYAFYSYTWFHFDTHKKLKKAYPKSVCPAFAFYKEWYKNGRPKCQWPETAPYWVEERTGKEKGEPTNCWPIYMNFFLILRWFLEVCIRLETLHSDSVVSE